MYLIEPYRNGEYIDDGAYALAIQVYVKNNIFLDEGILFPYYCKPKIEIGKFQNARAEVNQEYIDDNDIIVVRRDTGGGAVLVDEGAVNICFLIPEQSGLYGNYKQMYQPVINALNQLGVQNVEQSGRNDLLIHGKKISGAAMTKDYGRVYGGFSLLLDIHPERMVAALNPNKKKIESKGIKSVKSRVTTIREHLNPSLQHIKTSEFKDLIITTLLGLDRLQDAKRYELTQKDWAEIDKLVAQKYKNWDWNYGESPKYSYHRDGHTSAGTIDISLEVENGKISQCSIYGDFFGQGHIKDIEQALIGTKLKQNDLMHTLNAFNLNHYFGNVNSETLTNLILS